MKIGTFLLALVQPIISRVLAALGLSVVTIVGTDQVLQALRNQLQSSFAGLPVDMLNLFLLAGGGLAMGMILGAIATRFLLWQIQRSTQILGRNNA